MQVPSEFWIYDVRPGQETELQLITGHTHDVATLAYSPDSEILATGSWDNTVRLWDTQIGELKTTLEGHNEYITTVVYFPDGKTLTTVSLMDTVLQWDAETGTSDTTLFKRLNGNWTMKHRLKCAPVCVDQPNNYANPSFM